MYVGKEIAIPIWPVVLILKETIYSQQSNIGNDNFIIIGYLRFVGFVSFQLTVSQGTVR